MTTIVLVLAGMVLLGVLFAPLVGGHLRAMREGSSDPKCFNSYPGPQEQAENDCYHCKLRDICSPTP